MKRNNFLKHYEMIPPDAVLDDQGVRHVYDIPLPAKYGEGECKCGSHPLDSDTWYHVGLRLTVGWRIGVYRACKNCREILIRKKEEPK
jgi:hypothetical protein